MNLKFIKLLGFERKPLNFSFDYRNHFWEAQKYFISSFEKIKNTFFDKRLKNLALANIFIWKFPFPRVLIEFSTLENPISRHLSPVSPVSDLSLVI